MKYGRLAARRPIGLADLSAYLSDPLPPAPAQCVAPCVTDWGMLGNDTAGDCTIAGAVHLRMANAAEHESVEPWPGAQDALATYYQLTGGADTGLAEADVLATWQSAGLFGSTIAGYAPVDHRNADELRSVVAAFGGSYLGVAMPAPAQAQFRDGEPWDLTGTVADRQIEGGHCVPMVGYDAEYTYVVTWGALQRVTWRWLGAYLEEGWAVITPEDERVDLSGLQRDLAALA